MSEDRHVLCVDDDPTVVELTATFLRRELAEATVTTATSASEGLAMLDDGEVDCIVSDYEMPGQSGLAFLRAVRERDQDLPFVLFTGEGSEEIASEAISAGVTDYLQKRGDQQYELLANRVDNAVSQWRAERDLQRTREKMAHLHETAIHLRGAEDVDAVFERGIEVANEVLAFDICGFFAVDDGEFVPTKMLNFPTDFDRLSVEEGLVGESYRTNESILVDDLDRSAVAAPVCESFRCCLSVPMGSHGVFQAIATEPGFFDERDVELAELLVSHVAGALDRLEYEQSLRDTDELLDVVLENTTAHIYVKDLDGRYTLVNDQFADRLGLDPGEIVGRTDRGIQDPAIAEEIRANDRRAIEEGEPIEVEESARWDDERRVYYSVKAPLFDDHGEPKGVCGVSSDITRLKARERELQRKTERLDEFVSVVSHDLRNPLSVAKGHLESIDADREVVVQLETSLARMEEIVDDLLALARCGRCIGDTERVSLATVVDRAWCTVETGDARLRVETDRVVDADPSRLQQLFENLFRNAVEHGSTSPHSQARGDAVEHSSTSLQQAGDAVEQSSTSPRSQAREDAVEQSSTSPHSQARGDAVDHGSRTEPASPTYAVETDGPLTVLVEDTDEGFAVADDGPGLPGDGEEVLAAGFSTADDGTGFGLTIVDRIAEAHGWGLRVADAGPGARFEFALNR